MLCKQAFLFEFSCVVCLLINNSNISVVIQPSVSYSLSQWILHNFSFCNFLFEAIFFLLPCFHSPMEQIFCNSVLPHLSLFIRLLCQPHGRLRRCAGLPRDTQPGDSQSHGLHQEG